MRKHRPRGHMLGRLIALLYMVCVKLRPVWGKGADVILLEQASGLLFF